VLKILIDSHSDRLLLVEGLNRVGRSLVL